MNTSARTIMSPRVLGPHFFMNAGALYFFAACLPMSTVVCITCEGIDRSECTMENTNLSRKSLYQEGNGDGRDGLEHGPLDDELRHRRRMPFLRHVATVVQLVCLVPDIGNAVTNT